MDFLWRRNGPSGEEDHHHCSASDGGRAWKQSELVALYRIRPKRLRFSWVEKKKMMIFLIFLRGKSMEGALLVEIWMLLVERSMQENFPYSLSL